MNKIIYLSLLGLACTIVDCSKHASAAKHSSPSKVEKSSDPNAVPKVVLTADARSRLGIEVRQIESSGNHVSKLPLSSLIYDTKGHAWVFVESVPLEYHRENVRVLKTIANEIEVESAISGPVVVQGAAELNGTESGVGK